MKKGNERGGVVSFVIVGLLLAGLLLGGLYLSKHQARVAYNGGNSSSTTTTQDKTKNSGTDKNITPATKDEAPAKDTHASGDTKTTPSTNANNETHASGTSTNVAQTGPSSVAATGPTETFMTLAVLAVLAYTVTRFVQTKRHFVNSSLDNN